MAQRSIAARANSDSPSELAGSQLRLRTANKEPNDNEIIEARAVANWYLTIAPLARAQNGLLNAAWATSAEKK